MRSLPVRAATMGLALLLLGILGPLLYQLIAGSLTTNSIQGPAEFTLEHYTQLLQDTKILHAALNTLVFAAGSAILAIAIGGSQAWIAERTNAPLRRLAYINTVILIGSPYLVYVIAWMLIIGRNGLLNSLLAELVGSDNPAIIRGNSLGGMILIEGLMWSPLAFLLVAAAFKQANPSYEEAARMSGAGTFTMMRRVTFPLAWPAILAVGLLAFVRASEAFEVPAVVGMPGGVDVVTTRVYEAVTRGLVPNYGYANALSVVLAIVVGVLLWRYNLLSKKGERYQVVSGEAYRPGVLDIGGWKYLCTAIQVVLFTLGVALPMVVLAWVSLVPVYQGANSTMLHFTTDNYREAMAAPALLEGATNTVVLCLGSALVACLLTALVAWFVVRRSAGAAVLDHLVSVPMIIPGIVIGIAIAQVGLSSPVPMYGTVWILGLGYFVSFLPFTMRFAYSGVIQIRNDLEESALVSGASRAQVFVKIVLPLLSTSLLMGGIFSFMQGARALSMPIFLSSPDHPVAAVSLYDAYVNGSTTVVAAFGLIWTVVMVAVSSFVFWLSSRSKVAVL